MARNWTPIIAEPGSGVPVTAPDPLDVAHAAAREHRNGLPEPAPYLWRPGEEERARAVQARLAAIRGQLLIAQVFADAIEYRRPEGGCGDCLTDPGGLCDDHAADLGLTDAYIALAGDLGINLEGTQ